MVDHEAVKEGFHGDRSFWSSRFFSAVGWTLLVFLWLGLFRLLAQEEVTHGPETRGQTKSPEFWANTMQGVFVGSLASYLVGGLHTRLVSPSQRKFFISAFVIFPSLAAAMHGGDKTVNLDGKMLSEGISRHGVGPLLVAIFGVCVGLSALTAHLLMARAVSRRYAALWFVALVLVLTSPYLLAMTAGCKVHLHHWYYATAVGALCHFNSATSAVFQGALLGYGLQGAGMWGLDPVFILFFSCASKNCYTIP